MSASDARAFRDRAGRRAFTLMELSIVLGIVGLILAAAWAAGGPMFENRKVENVIRQVMTVVNDTRDHYMAVQTLPAAAGTDITGALDCLSLIPDGLRVAAPACPAGTGGSYRSDFGGAFSVLTVSFLSGSGAVNSFRVQLPGISQAGCIKLLSQLPITDPGVGIEQITVNTTPRMAITGYGGVGGTAVWNIASAPPTVTSGWCDNSAAGGTNEVDLDFKLHP